MTRCTRHKDAQHEEGECTDGQQLVYVVVTDLQWEPGSVVLAVTFEMSAAVNAAEHVDQHSNARIEAWDPVLNVKVRDLVRGWA